MPRFDKTGPEGEGPRTGRGLGKCSEDYEPKGKRKYKEKSEDEETGTGLGPCGNGIPRGLGRGRGCRFGRMSRRR